MLPEEEHFALVILSPGKTSEVVARMIPVVNLITKPDLGGLPPKPPPKKRVCSLLVIGSVQFMDLFLF